MKSSFRIGAGVVGVYWLMLVAGMVLYSAIRIDTIGVLIPIWIGAIGGTVLGQAFALKRTRLWVPIVAAIGVVMFFGTNLSDVLESVLLDVPRHYSSSRLWWSFLPAVVCGYWSLGDRSSLAAFWFPAMVWMLSILDHSTASAILDQSGIVLLCGLVAAFVLFLRVRESRRIELWRAIATTPLVVTTPAVVLEEDPDHRLVRTGWTFVTIVLTFAATAWVAPRLWQGESFDAHSQQPQIVDGLPCCPTPEEIQTTRSRVKEYFDIGRGHDAYDHEPLAGVNCRICRGPTTEIAFESEYAGDSGLATMPDLPIIPNVPYVSSTGYASTPGTTETNTPVATTTTPGTIAPPAYRPSPPIEPPPLPPTASSPPPPPPPPHANTTPPPPQPHPHQASASPAPTVSHAHADPPSAATRGPAILRWLAVLVVALLLFQSIVLALRPLRRLVTLRHLRRPYWAETVDQRISNSWQLALVGLRDAGWRSIESEGPREFARRVRVDGIERCATILERARHGISIDGGDLAEMNACADLAYRSARSRIGVAARIASWMRWPLG